MSTQQTMKYAIRCHQHGRLAEAERLYRDIIREEPQHCDALHLLGLIRIDQRDYQAGVRLIESAVATNPRFAKAHFNLGIALTKLDRYNDAIASFDRALRLAPAHADSWHARGNALAKAERTDEAIESFGRALALQPEHVGALLSRAAALVRLDRFAEAEEDLDRALALQPQHLEAHVRRAALDIKRKRPAEALERLSADTVDLSGHVEAWCIRGRALAALERFEDALHAYDRALALRRENVEASTGRGAALSMLFRFDEALAEYDRALQLNPNHAEAHYNRGLALGELDRLEEAFNHFDLAVALNPRYVQALANLATVLSRFRHFPQALVCAERALAIEPEYLPALVGMSDTLVKLRRFDDALASYRKLLELQPAGGQWLSMYIFLRNNVCDWPGLADIVARLREDFGRTDRPPIAPLLLMSLDSTREEQLQVAQRFTVSTIGSRPHKGRSPITCKPHEKIRVAYVSANFNRHPVAYAIAELMERHDRSQFHVIGIALGGDDLSDMRKRIAAACDSFHEVNLLSDEAVADLMVELEVDIAVDLMGHTEDARRVIHMLRPAPVQVNYLGYPGTTAEPWMDYVIADPYLIPPEHRDGYSECVARLPHSYMPLDTKWGASEQTPTREGEKLPADGFVFCSFNTHYKITPAMFDVWMRLLANVEGSVLWLQGNNAFAERNLKKMAAERGIEPSRLIFAARTADMADHLARHRLADLFLDTTPYNAHTTARDALWMGLPVLTVEGPAFASRVAGSLLHAVGLPQLVAPDLAAYEAMALKLARDAETRAALKRHLAEARATQPLFDIDLYRRHLEAAFKEMIGRARCGEPPQDFDVAALMETG